jgi:hypothetical protein
MFGSRSEANCDLTKTLQNFSLTCQNQALKCRQRAELEAALPVYGKELTRNRDKTVQRCEAEAQVWEQRAKVADEGFLLLDTSDSTFMLKNGKLIAQASAQGRTRRVEDANASDARLATQSGLPPVQTGAKRNPTSP